MHGCSNSRLMTSHGQQVCTTLLPRRRAAIRRQVNGRHPTLRPNKPLQYAQPAHQPVHRQPPGSGVHPCTAPCTRRCRPTRKCESLTGFNLPSVAHRPVHAVRQRPVHSQRQLATAVQPIPAGTRAAACTTVAQVCHIFSSPPALATPASGAHPCTARAHGGARPPRSLDLELVSTCHPSCTAPCTRFRSNPHA